MSADRTDVEAHLRQLAYSDHLTGLPNRVSMRSRIEAALERADREGSAAALVFLDLDAFKLVHDTLGHTLGDEVLLEVARRLRERSGPGVSPSRYAGDEFLLLLEDLPHHPPAATAAALAVTERLQGAFTEPFSVGGATFELTASAGVALYPLHAADATALLECADGAMYAAKQAGRARTELFEGNQERSFRALEATLRVRQALAASELELHYQPVVEIADGEGLGGLEALIRWRDPDRGLVSPGEFLPLIEHSPLLEEIGEWVFRTVCVQLEAWRTRGFEPRISFNIPARQLRRPGFAEFIIRTAGETGADLTRIAAEITESAYTDLDPVLPVLERLRAAGLVLSLDDFGTGYSSFARLRDMPFSLLKTDLSFMRGVPDDPTAVELLQAMVRLGRALGLVVIVEGVETTAQRDRLLAIGVRVAQGFLFGRAEPAADIEARFSPAAAPRRRSP